MDGVPSEASTKLDVQNSQHFPRNHVVDIIDVVLGNSPLVAERHKASGYGLDLVNVIFGPDNGYSENTFVRPGSGGYEIMLSGKFIDRLAGFIACFLATMDKFSEKIADAKATEPSAEFDAYSAQLKAVIRNSGALSLWANVELSGDAAVYISIINSYATCRPLHAKVIKMAVFAAAAFLSLHEAAHARGGHTIYWRKWTEEFCDTDGPKFSRLNPHLEVFEFAADLSSQMPLFITMASHLDEFQGHVLFKDTGEIDRTMGLYLLGYAAGFGITSMFLLTDALNDVSSDDYHPSSLQRILTIAGSTLAVCVKYRDYRDHSEQALQGLYNLGLFEGAKQSISQWDELGFVRRKVDSFENFFHSNLPCILCNKEAKNILGFFEKIQDRINEIQLNMHVWGIESQDSFMMLTSLPFLTEKYEELRKSYKAHQDWIAAVDI